MKAKKLHYTQVGARRYQYEGQWMTLREISETYGLPPKTLQSRIAQGWDITRAVETPMIGFGTTGGHRWRTHPWRKRALHMVRSYFVQREMKNVPRTVEDMPLEFDPWSQAAIDVACEDGGMTLDEVGHIQGGVSRERIRQVQETAFHKIRERASRGDTACQAFLSHWERRL